MFEAIELGQSMKKRDFKAREPELRSELMKLQLEMTDEKISTLIIVGGVPGAGKGDVIDRLCKWLDSRGIQTHAFWDETDEDRERPREWRFWKRMPARGTIGIMFGGWYLEPMHQHTNGEIETCDFDEFMTEARELERMLYNDGMLIIKLWYHLSEKGHRKRIKQRKQANPHIRHNDTGMDKEHYQAFVATAERALRDTDTGECPWYIIESEDRWFRDMTTGTIIKNAMSARLASHRVSDRRAIVHDPVVSCEDNPRTILDKIDLSASLSKDEYDEQLKYYQAKLLDLSWQMYEARRSTVMVFEGADAAGKGGAIRRLTNAIDSLLYRVISVAAPTDEELAHHYLWRFWRQFPRAGYITIYDRSWYGRVLVERVEGFAEQYEWMRAYSEINNFEERMTDHGTVVMKFWLHISQDTQLARFKEREVTPWKQHKITDEDWRNRDKWDDYKKAINDMVIHTSTPEAPWTLVSSENKLHARVEVIKTVCERLERALSE